MGDHFVTNTIPWAHIFVNPSYIFILGKVERSLEARYAYFIAKPPIKKMLMEASISLYHGLEREDTRILSK